MTVATLKVRGEKYVVIPEREYLEFCKERKRAEDSLPPLPEADAEGGRPAHEFIAATIARRLITSRRAAGLSQARLAKLAGVRQETLSRIESGKHSPTVRTLGKIERALARISPAPARRRKH